MEPLIILTVLNCIFMFSSTVTTCALWWQYHGQRCCPRNNTQQKFSKKLKNYTLQTTKKPGKLDFDSHANIVSKSDANVSREYKNKRCQKRKRSKKDLKYQNRSGENISFPNELKAKKFNEKDKTSEASQTINNTKSTIVMELSTVQKIMQIVDNNPHINTTQASFKEIVI
ncbi:uncharacterized protein LOC114254869 [Monomorium pharaonis]|uniref:uncharacterized protein LOC114254869 n=1 Tax=Monomorium pharaonis TaxID=307658 RepID=UPI0017462450|nr:uncharacterized protein LOC114254869 [Monomorium pharaonis]